MITAYEVGVSQLLWGILPPEQQPDPEPGHGDTDLPVVRDDDDLDRVLRDYLGVKLPNTKCCESHQTPWEAVHDAYFARSVVAIWKASRGLGGKSFTLSALGLAEALFLRADVNILGGSGIQSKRVLESIADMWDRPTAPKQCLIGEPGSQVQKMVWGNRIQALMASSKSVRGPHPQRLRLDEVDEIKQTILDSALGQPMTKGGITSHVVGASTHQYPDGTMTAMIKRARTTPGWRFFEWCYRENLEPHGWLSLAEVQRKQSVVTALMWATEFEGQEPSSEGRAIDTAKVDAAFVPVEGLPAEADLVTYVLELPDQAGKYGSGADWAKKRNYTVVVTIRKDVRPMRVVAVKRVQKEPWPSMAGYLDERVARFGGTSCHDNTGIGQVVHDLLHHSSDPFNMVGRDRADLLSEYIAALEKGDLVWPRDDTNQALAAAYSEHKYATRDDVYKGTKDGTGKHHLPDTISAGALAWRAAKDAEPAGAMSEPETGTPLQDGFVRGRLSAYMLGRRRPTE